MLLCSPDGKRGIELVPLAEVQGETLQPVGRRGLRTILFRVRWDEGALPDEGAMTVDRGALTHFATNLAAILEGTGDRISLLSDCRRYQLRILAAYDHGPVWITVDFEGRRLEFTITPEALAAAAAFARWLA